MEKVYYGTDWDGFEGDIPPKPILGSDILNVDKMTEHMRWDSGQEDPDGGLSESDVLGLDEVTEHMRCDSGQEDPDGGLSESDVFKLGEVTEHMRCDSGQEKTGTEGKSVFKCMPDLSKSRTGQKDEKYAKYINDDDIKQQSDYIFAKNLIEQYDLRCLADPKIDDGIYLYNGKSWRLQNKKDIIRLIYSSIPESKLVTQTKIRAYCDGIRDYIMYGVWNRYANGQGKFSKKAEKAIQRRIVFKNAVYDLEDGRAYEHDRALPYYFDIDCKYLSEDAETPFYDQFKEDATGGDQESMDMIDYMLAYLMMPDRSGKLFFVMSYAKDSGKSMFGYFITRLLGPDRCKTMDPDNLGRFSFGDAQNTLLYSCLEMSTTKLSVKAATELKRKSGEEQMRSEAKYKDEKTIPIRFKMLFASNGGLYLPEENYDKALYRRLVVIPFIQSTPLEKLNSNLANELWKERHAIVSKAARKFAKYIQKDSAIIFPQSELSLSLKESWMGKAGIESGFAEDSIEFTGNPADIVSKDEVYEEYCRIYQTKTEGVDNPGLMYTKKGLIDYIKRVYPSVNDKKVRHICKSNPEGKPIPCLQGIKLRILIEVQRRAKGKA